MNNTVNMLYPSILCLAEDFCGSFSMVICLHSMSGREEKVRSTMVFHFLGYQPLHRHTWWIKSSSRYSYLVHQGYQTDRKRKGASPCSPSWGPRIWNIHGPTHLKSHQKGYVVMYCSYEVAFEKALIRKAKVYQASQHTASNKVQIFGPQNTHNHQKIFTWF